MRENTHVKEHTPIYRIWEVNARFYSVKGTKKTFSFRKLRSNILKYFNIRVSRYLGNAGLGYEQLAAFQSGASSQLKVILNTVDIDSYEGYTYGLEVSMIVTDLTGGNRSEIPIDKVFYRNFKDLVRDRGRLVTDQSWISKAADQARLVEGGHVL